MNKEKWLKQAAKEGFDQAEIYETTSRSKEVSWFDGQMDKMELSDTASASIRALYKGNLAQTGLEKLDDEIMEEVFEALKEQAQTITSDDRPAFVEPVETELVKKDNVWVRPSTPEVLATLKQLEADILAYDKRILQASSLGWSESSGTRAITNSLGLHTDDEDYVQYVAAACAARDGDVIQDYYLIKVVPDLAHFARTAFVKELCDEALFRTTAASVPSRNYPVILHRDAMSSLLASFAGLFSGETISRNISPLKDKLGTQVFSKEISIIDDPRNTDALSVANFDDEGSPTRRKYVVKDGVFETILHNTTTASRMGMETTGNGFRGGYASPVGVSPMNMYIEPGKHSLDELQEKMGDGLVITDLEGLHAGIDFVSTNFSLQARGYKVENGKKRAAVTLITAADSFLHLMNQVVEVGSDLDWKYLSIVSPSILFKGISISGE